MSTIGEAATRRCAGLANDRGVGFVDAPVLGPVSRPSKGTFRKSHADGVSLAWIRYGAWLVVLCPLEARKAGLSLAVVHRRRA